MKRPDEMEKHIQLRSESWGFRAAVWALIFWTLIHLVQVRTSGVRPNPVPSMILAFAMAVQSFSQIIIKRRMVAGDEEYREANRLLQAIMAGIVIAVLGAWVVFLVRW